MMYELIFILNNMETFKWSDALFLPENEVWDNHTKGLIQDPDDIENDEDELPKAAIENHFIYTYIKYSEHSVNCGKCKAAKTKYF